MPQRKKNAARTPPIAKTSDKRHLRIPSLPPAPSHLSCSVWCDAIAPPPSPCRAWHFPEASLLSSKRSGSKAKRPGLSACWPSKAIFFSNMRIIQENVVTLHHNKDYTKRPPLTPPLWGKLKIDEVNRRSVAVPPAPDHKEEG